MRIIVVNENCGYLGGLEQNIADSVIGLKTQKHHTCYLAYNRRTSIDSNGYQELFEDTFQIDFSGRNHDTPSLTSVCRKIQPDVLYFHKCSSIQPFQEAIRNVHAVRMIHDHDLCCPRRHKYFSYSNRICHQKAGIGCWLDGAFLKRDRTRRVGFAFNSISESIREMKRNYLFSCLLVASRFMRQELLSNGFREDQVSILPPIGIEQTESEDHLPLPENELLYVGQLIHGKGVDLLLKALSSVSSKFRLTIVGRGNAQKRLQDMASNLNLADRVDFAGWVDHAQLDAFYQKAKAVLVPSRWPEPFGMVGLEAMKHSRPVIAFDAGGISDWLIDGKTGILVPEQDVDAFTAAINRLLMDTETASELGRNGFEHLQAHFRYDDYLDRLETHLDPNKRTESLIASETER
jgi:glycosyltransferase involved in cell wall biosynthesis